MIEDAEARGILKPGAMVIEPTSGNTGVGLAGVCALRGYRLVLTMPESMSAERRMLLAALGAELVLTPAAEGMAGAVAKANRSGRPTPAAGSPASLTTLPTPRRTCAPRPRSCWRIWTAQSTLLWPASAPAGTITGVGRVLKQALPACRIIGVEPEASPLVSKGWAGAHPIQGIGANFVPSVLDVSLMDQILTVSGEDAFETCRVLGRCQALLVGISSGAAVWAAAQVARREDMAGRRIVVLCPDTGERYLSSQLYQAP